MQKKTLKYILLAVIGVLMVAMSIGIYVRYQAKQAELARLLRLPNFEFRKLNGETFTKEQLSPDKSTVFLYFDPDCAHCEEQIRHMQEQPAVFAESEVVLISGQAISRVAEFSVDAKIDSFPNYILVLDELHMFPDSFGYTTTPTTVMYSKQGEFRGHIEGQVKVEAIANMMGVQQ